VAWKIVRSRAFDPSEVGGVDATHGFRIDLRRNGETYSTYVYVVAYAPSQTEHEETRSALRTRGSSALGPFLDADTLPAKIVCGSGGCRPPD